MYGLKLKKDHIVEIIMGKRTYESFIVDTSIRGKIGIIDSDSYELIMYLNLDSVTKTTFEEHILSQVTDSFSKSEANKYINNLDFTKLKSDAYLYNFKDLDVLKTPCRIKILNETQIWVNFDEKLIQEGYEQVSLFDL